MGTGTGLTVVPGAYVVPGRTLAPGANVAPGGYVKTGGAGVAAVGGVGGGGNGGTGVGANVLATGAGVGTTVRDLLRVFGRGRDFVVVFVSVGGSLMPLVVNVSLRVWVRVMGRVCVFDEVGSFDSVRVFLMHTGYL